VLDYIPDPELNALLQRAHHAVFKHAAHRCRPPVSTEAVTVELWMVTGKENGESSHRPDWRSATQSRQQNSSPELKLILIIT